MLGLKVKKLMKYFFFSYVRVNLTYSIQTRCNILINCPKNFSVERVAIFREKKLFREILNRWILIHSVGILSVLRNGKCNSIQTHSAEDKKAQKEFRSEQFRRREKTLGISFRTLKR